MRYDRPQQSEPLRLFDEVPVLRHGGHAESIQESFEAFDRENPWVYTALVRLARDARAQGRERVGIGMLFEVLRWHYSRATRDAGSEFKLNNNYRSRYARKIMEAEADLADAFEVRGLKAA